MSRNPLLRIDELTGMRVGLVGLAVAAVGAGMAFTVFPLFGYWVAVLGVFVGIVGVALHWVKNWRSIFGSWQ